MKTRDDWLHIYDWIMDCLIFVAFIALATFGLLF